MPHLVIEEPRHKSVGELRGWLQKFGDNNKKHFETVHALSKGQSSSVEDKIRKFEENSGGNSVSSNGSYYNNTLSSYTTTSSQTSSNDSITPTTQLLDSLSIKEVDKRADKNYTKTHKSTVSEPVFRRFDNKSIDKSSVYPEQYWRAPDEPETIRIIGLDHKLRQKQHASTVSDVPTTTSTLSQKVQPQKVPQKQQQQQQELGVEENITLEALSSNFNAKVNDDDNDDDVDDEESCDSNSAEMGSVSSASKLDDVHNCCWPLTPNTENDKAAKDFIRSKLPMLFCKTTKNNTDNDDNNYNFEQINHVVNVEELSNVYNTLINFAIANTTENSVDQQHTKQISSVIEGNKSKDSYNSSNTLPFYDVPMFDDRILTVGKLDLLCFGREESETERPSFFSEDSTSISQKSADSDAPSVHAGAVTGSLGEVFTQENLIDLRRQAQEKLQKPSKPNSKAIFRSNSAREINYAQPKWPKYQETIKNKDNSSSSSQLPVSNVLHKARQFERKAVSSGQSKQSKGIAQKKAQLEKLWAEDRLPMHTKKIKWQVSNSSGTYKKKVTIDVADTKK